MAFALVVLLPQNLPAGVIFTNLVTFNCTNGATPTGPLFLASNGNLYGTTEEGGTNTETYYCAGAGTVFELTLSGAFTTLTTLGMEDGIGASGPLAQGGDGLLYGTTCFGGASIWGGTVFRLSSSNTLTTLCEFNGTNGVNPNTGLVRGVDGNLYGVTYWGGAGHPDGQGDGHGTVFKVTTNGLLTTIHSFNLADGKFPGGLVKGRNGDLYGTTEGGGSYADQTQDLGFGTIYRISSDDAFTSLFSFGGTNGYLPGALLAEGHDGNLYGTTVGGGSAYEGSTGGFGTVFRFSPAGGLTTLHEFTGGADGGRGWGGLVRGSDGSFYGTTAEGGTHGRGTFFRITADGEFSVFYSFTTDQGFVAAVTQGTDGRFYATSLNSGPFQNGNIFRLSVPMPPMFQSVEKIGDRLNVTWTSVAEQAYQLQYASTINSTNWTDLGSSITATNGTTSASDSVSVGRRFYRVVLLP